MIATWLRMIRFSHSVFALPFALASAALAARRHGVTGWQLAWIVVAMVSARSAAMGFNRIADREIDARNPRTAGRELPSGAIGLRAAWAFTVAAAGVFVLAAGMLGPWCLALSPAALVVLFGYSLAKRFTSMSHLLLGLALGLAPVAAWLAVSGGVSWTSALLGATVACWVAGFDLLYACQDADFDRREGLHSVPARFGVAAAMRLSAALHLLAAAGLAALPLVEPLRWPYLVGLAAMVALLAWEHAIVGPGRLDRLDRAFFDLNGYVSLVFLAGVLAGL